MEFRIKKYKRGWVVEVKKPKWTLFGIKLYWTHYISTAGISTMPWHFTKKEYAMQELTLKVAKETDYEYQDIE